MVITLYTLGRWKKATEIFMVEKRKTLFYLDHFSGQLFEITNDDRGVLVTLPNPTELMSLGLRGAFLSGHSPAVQTIWNWKSEVELIQDLQSLHLFVSARSRNKNGRQIISRETTQPLLPPNIVNSSPFYRTREVIKSSYSKSSNCQHIVPRGVFKGNCD